MRHAQLHTPVLAALVMAGLAGTACGQKRADKLSQLALEAVNVDVAQAQSAVAELRAAGPAGLDALFQVHASAIRRITEGGPDNDRDDALRRIRSAVDAVSGQRDAHTSRLYWHTDLAAAQAAAARQHKPILSLRLLGKLTDEYSCANSRFFRSTLYCNAQISQALRKRFVLHWQTVRPVPTVTIDFGDGRKLVRTVTGNSAHYLLAADGRPLDVLPGLYSPQVFQQWLDRVEQLAEADSARGADRTAILAKYHVRRVQQLQQAWQRDMQALKLAASQSPPDDPGDAVWKKVATLHYGHTQLDDASRRAIANKNPVARRAGQLAMTKRVAEDPLVELVRQLQETTTLDTLHNEHVLHRKIHQWFAAGQVGPLDDLNERVYAELFLTPSSDPWLGLFPSSYTGLERDGVVLSAQK